MINTDHGQGRQAEKNKVKDEICLIDGYKYDGFWLNELKALKGVETDRWKVYKVFSASSRERKQKRNTENVQETKG